MMYFLKRALREVRAHQQRAFASDARYVANHLRTLPGWETFPYALGQTPAVIEARADGHERLAAEILAGKHDADVQQMDDIARAVLIAKAKAWKRGQIIGQLPDAVRQASFGVRA